MPHLQPLRAARLAAGLTYREVAQAAGLDPSTVAHYEAQRAAPSAAAFARWRKALAALLSQRREQITEALKSL